MLVYKHTSYGIKKEISLAHAEIRTIGYDVIYILLSHTRI